MNASSITYSFQAVVWQHDAPGGWYFVSMPLKLSAEIREHYQSFEEGWGRLKCQAEVRGVKWKTAIWFDTKRSCYILPLKADIRQKTSIEKNVELEVHILL